MKNIVVACASNSCRSQITEAFLRYFGKGQLNVYSAGTTKSEVNPFAIEVMKEIGINMAAHTSKAIDELPQIKWDIALTVCDPVQEACPYIPAKEHLHHAFFDPVLTEGTDDEIRDSFRKVRDEIKVFCSELTEKLIAK